MLATQPEPQIVANNLDNTIEIIDGATAASTGQITLGGSGTPWNIAVNQTTGVASVTAGDFAPGAVSVIDTAMHLETTSIAVLP